jgi:hypothetical protein
MPLLFQGCHQLAFSHACSRPINSCVVRFSQNGSHFLWPCGSAAGARYANGIFHTNTTYANVNSAYSVATHAMSRHESRIGEFD